MQARPLVTVDVAMFTVADGVLRLALAKRTRPPFEGRLALIGGAVDAGEDRDTAATAHRILRDKAGLTNVFVEQLMTFSGATRDPRGWSVAIVYYALVPEKVLAAASPAARDVTLAPAERLPVLAFDHNRIAAAALERLRGKGSYSTLPAFLLADEFTLPELKAAYETVMGTSLNDSAFRRKIGDLGIIEEVADAKSPATAARRRPAQLYRLKRRTLVAFDSTV